MFWIKTYSQVEGILYSHFERIEERERLKSALKRTERRMENIKRDIKTLNYDLEVDIKGISYDSVNVVNTKDTSSSMEKEILILETKAERDYKEEIKYRGNTMEELRGIQKQIDYIEVTLEQLPINEVEFIELLYKDKLSYRRIGSFLNCDKNVIGRNKKEIIKKLMKIF